MNVNVRLSKTLFCFVVLVFNLSSVCHTIIHSSFGRLRNGWGIRPANHFYQCDGLKTSGSRFSLEVESVVSSYCLSIFCFMFWSKLSAKTPSYYSFVNIHHISGPFSLDTSHKKVATKKEMLGMVLYNESIHMAD